MIQIRESIPKTKESTVGLEKAALVYLHKNDFHLTLMCCYNPPQSNKISFHENFDKCLEEIPSSIPSKACGDFNKDSL